MRHQIAIIVLILAAASAVSAAEINCTSLTKPIHNFYEPTGACTNDTLVALCLSTYETCLTAAGNSCTSGFACVTGKLRCLEAITTSNTDCAAWAAMLGNEKLYIAAGGEYNGSTLELSCRNVVCAFQKRKSLQCPVSSYEGVCVDPFTNAPPPGTVPPGAVKVLFTISGNREKFAALLSTEAGRRQAFEVVGRLLMAILGITDASKLVVTDVRLGSLIVEFYTTDPNLSADSVRQLLNNVNDLPNKDALFQELATLAGIPVSELGVSGVEVTTTAPLTPPDAASFAAVAAALAAALLAMLL